MDYHKLLILLYLQLYIFPQPVDSHVNGQFCGSVQSFCFCIENMPVTTSTEAVKVFLYNTDPRPTAHRLSLRCVLEADDKYSCLESTGNGNHSECQFSIRDMRIMKGREIIAAIRRYREPEKSISDSKLYVSGNLTGWLDQEPYLQIEWPDPGSRMIGTFKCVANVEYKGVVLSEMSSPSLEIIYPLTQFATVNMQISDLQDIVDGLAKQRDIFDKTLRIITESFQSEFAHVEQGHYKLYSPSGASNHRITFKKQYSHIPVVTTTFTAVDYSSKYNFKIFVTISNLSTTGFDMIVQTWSQPIVNMVEIEWNSFST